MKKFSWKKFLSTAVMVIGAVSGLMSIIKGMSELIDQLSGSIGVYLSYILVIFNVVILFPLSIIIVLALIINFYTKKYRERIGTHGIPCTLFSMYQFKISNKNNKLLYSIHKDFYHHCYKIKDDIHNGRLNSTDKINEAFEEFLRIIHHSILKTFRLDLTINIKRLVLDRDDNLCLVPFIHYRNIAVRNQSNPRDFNYSYFIQLIESDRLSRYAQAAKNYRRNNEYEVNSIFTYLINERKRYWMSNDLRIDEEEGNFYTSSDNYPEYYRSLAVFSITPPEKKSFPEWLLILDTQKTGKFSEKECVNLFGYIAHLLHELLTEYNNYESKKKQKKHKDS